ncbi:hypothetical protein AAMO2058_001215100 [Amorphochlora amoebiformis]|mmetsp:Transcript_20326/g.32207  ORF Transcript_20326/g.32207 Transcript_20326/m.32207 type:complete len:301 (-) Transcript_20326:190-1092(-)
MSGPNPLVSLRSYFYLGLYDQLTKEAKTIGTLTGSTETERLAYVYRAYVAMGKHRKVAVEIKKGAPTVLQVIQLHSTYRTAKTDESRSMALDKLNEMVDEGSLAQDVLFSLVAAEMYLSAGEMKSALKLVYKGKTLDMMGMTITILLMIKRVDLAEKHLKLMQDIEEDDTLTQLASAWINVAKGDKLGEEALDTYQDLQEKFGSSVLILNSIAVCQIKQKNYIDALNTLGAARDLANKMKMPISPDTYINTMICLQHARKGQATIQKLFSDFKRSAPNHPWVKRQEEMHRAIEKSRKTYS